MEIFESGILALCGIIFLAAGSILYAFPPKSRNLFYGYRTMSSMASDERWKFSQPYSAVRMIESGAALLLLSSIGYFFELSESVESTINVLAILLSIGYMVLRTERALKIKFPKSS